MHHLHDVLVAWGPLGLLMLSLIESAGIPNPSATDAVLLVLCAARPSQAVVCALAAAAGSLTGCMVFFEIMRKLGARFLRRYAVTGRGARFQRWFQRYGMVTVFISALVPIPMPFKVLAACAGATGVSRTRFFLILLIARIPRYGGLAYLGAKLGEKDSSAWLAGHAWYMVGVAVALFAGLYGTMMWADRARRQLEISHSE
jgi:membrane protein YqaA with SNARE-associated domain